MNSKFLRLVAFVICAVMLISVSPISAFAAEVNYNQEDDDYYKLISKKDWELAPGVFESEIVINNDAGDRRQVMHVVEVDVDNEYTKVIPSSKGMIPTAGQYGVQTMDEQAAYAEEKGYGNVVAAMNISLSWYDSAYYDEHPELVGEPLGYLILDGVQYTNSQGKTSGAQTCLVINYDEKNGEVRPSDIPKTQIRSTSDAITGWEEQVIPANFGFLVKDGKMVNATEEHTSEGASRSMLGIKADGSIIMVMNDGRQAPYSTGFNSYEMSEAMLKLGCVYAINGDGGGSSQFLSKRPGEELTMNCSPSDGAARATTHGVLVISTAPSTGEFVRAHVETDSQYYTPNSSIQFKAIATDLAGSTVEIPAEALWQLSDASFGTIDENGLFISNGKIGEVAAELVYKGEVKGRATVNIVVPDSIAFGTAEAYTVPFGESINLSVTATYGVFDVTINSSDYTICVEDETLGNLTGNKYTAGETEGITNITVSLNSNSEISKTIPLTVGKGSEVIFSFEEGTVETNLDNWVIKDHEGKYTPYSDISIVTAEDGMVHNGERALAIHMPTHHHVDGGEGYNANSITWVGDPILLENATAIGMWIYIPEEATQTEIALNYVWYNDSGVQQRTTPDLCLNDSFNGNEYSGWHYLSVPISKSVAYIENAIVVEKSQGYKRNFFLKFYVTNSGNAGDESSYMGDVTYYIDDVTVDYSDAVDDRAAPVFSSTTIANLSSEVETTLKSGTIVNVASREINLYAAVSDNVAIDASTAKITIDGEDVSTSYKNGKIICDAVSLNPGVHRIVYEIADTIGNISKAVRYINIAGTDVAVNVVPHDKDAAVALTGSVYWLDVVAAETENISKITMKLDLDTMNSWELEHTELATGYKMEYYYDSVADKNDNTVTIILTNNGNVGDTKVLASIPVRVWSYSGNAVSSNITSAEAWTKGYITAVSVNVEVEQGKVDYADDSSAIFSAEKIHIDTEAYVHQYKMDKTYYANNTYHVHKAEAINDVEATCSKAGYAGRTYCEVCASVVEWGTVIPATGHNYVVTDGVLKCECGELFNGENDGITYIDGVVANGWSGDYYYRNGLKLTGSHAIDGVYYSFAEDGKVNGKITGLFFDDDAQVYRYAVLGVAKSGWYMIDSDWYYFRSGTCAAATGTKYYFTDFPYEFDETGKLLHVVWRKFGDSYRCYYGPTFYSGTEMGSWIMVEGKQYCFAPGGEVLTGYQVLHASFNTPYRLYQFDSKGVFIAEITDYNGFVNGFDGIRYFVNGEMQKGLQIIDGEYYYFSSTTGAARTGRYTVTVANSNGLLDKNTKFNFNTETGAAAEKPLNGFVKDGDNTYYYTNNVAQKGLQLIDGNYYYFSTNTGIMRTGSYTVTVANSNGLLSKNTKFTFDTETGAAAEKPLNGFVKDGDNTYYYTNNVAQKGLQLIDGKYYYFSTNTGIMRTGSYTVTVANSNGLLSKNTKFTFDTETGAAAEKPLNGFVKDGDNTYYYTNNVAQKGLQLIDGKYYYFSTNTGIMRTGTYRVSVANSNGLLTENTTFDFDTETGAASTN